MKIKIMSDLHMEMGHWTDPGKGETLIVAGDVNWGNKAYSWLAKASDSYKDVIFVRGNHDYYGNYIGDPKLHSNLPINVHVLDNTVLELKGQRFLGTTLWSSVTDIRIVQNSMNDYRHIKIGKRRLHPDDTNQLHQAAVGFIDREVDKRTIVVTHHMPSYDLVSKEFEGDILNQAYASNLNPLVARAKMWINGHTHYAYDTMLKGTRCICNPRGYPFENTGFIPNLEIEV